MIIELNVMEEIIKREVIIRRSVEVNNKRKLNKRIILVKRKIEVIKGIWNDVSNGVLINKKMEEERSINKLNIREEMWEKVEGSLMKRKEDKWI